MKVKKLLKKIPDDCIVGIYDQNGNWEKQYARIFDNYKYFRELKVKSIWSGEFREGTCINITVFGVLQ